ncbi:Fur family transcriptional regulator [Litoribacillus peritrichatus]|uniref:Zinc uptake transcriptional repressor Zur n=1 Tax=Litoribacillus peritrichatus TaxID=718191 RepID=A0ABP7NBY0_9GAMM
MDSAFSHHNHHQCQTSAVEQARRLCEEQGVRFTKLREQLFTLIWESHKPVTAYKLLDQIKDSDFSATPPTVYRTLDFLLEQGLIHRINSLNAFIGCCQPGARHTGTFIICERCEHAQEVDHANILHAIQQVSEQHHFQMKSYVTEVYGLCPQCQHPDEHDNNKGLA